MFFNVDRVSCIVPVSRRQRIYPDTGKVDQRIHSGLYFLDNNSGTNTD